MSENLHIVCPHCDSTNRVPVDKLAAGGKCGVCRQVLFGGEPIALTQANFHKHINNNHIPVVVDYWASWCGPCKMMAPVFAATARQLEPRLRFAKVDTESQQSLAGTANIRSIPTVVLYRGGREAARISGAMDQQNLVAWIEQNL